MWSSPMKWGYRMTSGRLQDGLSIIEEPLPHNARPARPAREYSFLPKVIVVAELNSFGKPGVAEDIRTGFVAAKLAITSTAGLQYLVTAAASP